MERVLKTNSRAGYTLVELMMIVVIIGISTIAFTPGFSRAMSDRRVSLAARELIRIGRRARADTFGFLRAHVVWINPATRNVQLLRGPTNSCALADWDLISKDCPATFGVGAGAPGFRCVENLFLASMSSASQPIGVFEEQLSGTNTTYVSGGRALCYAPSGVVSYGTGGTIKLATTGMTTDNPAAIAGGFVFALVNGTATPSNNNATNLRMHRVMFPLGASARSLR